MTRITRRGASPAPPLTFAVGDLPLAWQTRVDPADILIHITILGEPHAKQRPRHSLARLDDNGRIIQGHTYTPRATRDAETALRWGFVAQRRRPAPTPEPVGVLLWFRSRYGRFDVDNTVKTVLDAMNGTIIVDDQQVTEIHAHVSRRSPIASTTLLAWSRPTTPEEKSR